MDSAAVAWVSHTLLGLVFSLIRPLPVKLPRRITGICMSSQAQSFSKASRYNTETIVSSG